MPTRRDILKMGTALAAAPGAASEPAFRHRGYLGWITDLSSTPEPSVNWPSMRLDEALLRDYENSFAVLKKLGFNELSLWGMYVANEWPLDISSAVSPERGALVERLIASAHRHGLRVLNGFGLYSWGYAKIIQANPKLNGGNPNAMCASEPESWTWARKILDYTFALFPIDGVSMQSADKGRCSCERCRRWTDAEYHSRLNIQAADYIRAHWKNKVIGVSGWGMKFEDPASLPPVAEMSRHIDYLIDVSGSTQSREANFRREFIQKIHCDLGTLGGLQVEPPQHWSRDRWFLPTAQYDGEHLAELKADGGRACEYFFHILENPGDELSLWVVGKCLSDSGVPWQKHLRSSVEELYETTKPGTVDALCEGFLGAENAYMQYMPKHRSGTISMEPLVSNHAGPPVYLTKRLTAPQRAQYSKELDAVEARFRKLQMDVPAKRRMAKILQCLANVQRDIRSAA